MKDNKTASKKKKQTLRQEKRKRQRYLRISAAAIGLSMVLGYFLWPRPQAQAVSQDRLNDDPIIGSINAPVTIVEYGDFGSGVRHPSWSTTRL